MSRRLAPFVALVAVAALVAGCGSDSADTSTAASSSTTTVAAGASGASGASGPTAGQVTVNFQPPRGNNNALGATMLKGVGVENLISSFSTGFQLPEDLTVNQVNGFGGGPYYNPRNKSITFQYGFASLIFEALRKSHPDWSPHRLGEGVGAVVSFIYAHEFTHALIDAYDLPVLGREEDAADDLATLILIKAQNGGQFVSDSAQFWAVLSRSQRVPTVSDYADVHSLDLQRAYTMMCELAGSSQQTYAAVRRLNVLPAARLSSCPAEYQQKVQSFEQVLDPHIEGGVELSN